VGVQVGDICSVPFNIACGRCAACKRGDTGVCLNVNPARPGAAYGYVDMGGWIGGQSEYVMVPYADFNLLKFPDRDQALAKIKDLTLLSDIFPTGFHGAVQAGVKPGSIVYVAGAGPVGLASAASCHLLGAACVIVGDMIPDRLAQARSFGCETIDLRDCEGSLKDAIAELIPGSDGWVDGAVDCVGFEARGNGKDGTQGEVPAQVLNDCMDIVREGGSIGIPGLYVTEDPGGIDNAAQFGNLSMRMGLGWSKSHSMHTGQCPVMRYHKYIPPAALLVWRSVAWVAHAGLTDGGTAAAGI
jgi:glutathione-independent formaldehyde dehydrogenase